METLTQSSQILGEAIKRLDKKALDQSTKKQIRDVLSFTSSRKKIKTSRFKESLKQTFINMKKSIDWNIGNEGEKLRFKNLPNSDHTIAYVYGSDPARKDIIHLTEYFLKVKSHYSFIEGNKFDNIVTIIHEVSHFQKTKDYFYSAQHNQC